MRRGVDTAAAPAATLAQRAFSLLGVLWRFVRPHWVLAVVAVLLSLMAALVEGAAMGVFALVAQLLTSSSVEEAAAEFGRVGARLSGLLSHLQRDQLAIALLGVVVALQLLRSGLQFAGRLASVKMQTRIDGGTRNAIFNQLMRFSFTELKKYRTGEMSSLIEHVMYLGLVFSRVNTIVSQLVLMGVYLVVLVWLSVPMTLLVAAAGVLATLFLAKIVRRIRRQGTRYTKASVALSQDTVEFLHGVRLVQTYAREDFARERVRSIVERGVAAHRQGLLLQATVSPIMDAITILGIASVLILGIWQMGGLEGGESARLLTFLFVLYRFMPRIRILNDNAGHILGYLPFVERIAAVLDDEGKEFKRSGGTLKPDFKRDLCFEAVSYRYPSADRDAVHGLDFRLPKGSTLALVGPSGGGKSTVSDLLIGLIHPGRGRILVDGRPLAEIDWTAWRESLGVVSQDTFVFSASVAENIAFGDLDASPEKIEQAARDAGAHDFILEMEQGYDTLVGNQGTRLSGGQRQRIGIARALVRDPQVLILDEATSNLDSQAEREIQRSLRRASRDRTTLAIAHRLSTVAHADQILVIEGGRVVESGTHSELLTRAGRYAELWELQQAKPAADA